MKTIVVTWEGNSFGFNVDKEMIIVELGEYYAETEQYDKYWYVELSKDEWNDLGVNAGILTEDYQPNIEVQYEEDVSWEVGTAIDEIAYKELKSRFIAEFKNDWKNLISEKGGVKLVFPEGDEEIITT